MYFIIKWKLNANIDILLIFFVCIWVFVNQPTVHSEGVIIGGSVAVAVGVSEMLQVTGDTQHVTHGV